MTVDHVDGVAFSDVPDDDEVVVARAQQDVLCGRVPFQGHHTTSEKKKRRKTNFRTFNASTQQQTKKAINAFDSHVDRSEQASYVYLAIGLE